MIAIETDISSKFWLKNGCPQNIVESIIHAKMSQFKKPNQIALS